ncbi:MAG: phosphotransferase, partial [Gammaproteobacteria bacterium]|nr:phosphotransferase [Gammaproteobacteria bacterium]
MHSIDGLASADPQPASGDASFRRYFRLHSERDSFIAMDAPPQQEDCKPFIRIAGYLEAMQLNAPRVLEANLIDGFLLLTDLGSTQYLYELQAHAERAESLYADALHALNVMQNNGTAFQSSLPPYDDELLRFELSLFHDWLSEKHLGIEFSDDDEMNWQQLCDLLVSNALDQPQVFVHRDYHSRNLMVRDRSNPGILDFQDAVEGPLTYDLVSLLKDCYIQWPQQLVDDWAHQFYDNIDASMQQRVNDKQFMRYFDLMGVQRHLKASGIFARLNHRDGKPGYMTDVPRTLSYIIELGPRYHELQFLVELIR